MRVGRFFFGSVVVALGAVTLAAAQSGGIRVKAVDPGGRPVAGATVRLSNAIGLVAASEVKTDARGIGEFPVLRAGPGFQVAVRADGYREYTRADIRVSSGETQVIDASLEGFVQEEVVARAERPVVEMDTTAQTKKFDEQTLHDLPLQNRVYQNVLTLAPGVVDPDEDGNPNVNGARSRDVKIQLGGVANVDPLTGQWMSYINLDSIEELEVITAGAGAEFGRAQGGWGRILQKQGTNEFEGVVRVLYRSSKLDGNGASELSGSRLPEFSSYQPSLQFSGPILKDRLWFRLSHEWIDREDPVIAADGSLIFTELSQSIHSDQITWQASPRNKIAFHFDADPRTIVNPEARSSISRDASQTWEFGGPTYRLAWTAAQSPKLLVNSEVGYQDNAVNLLPTTEGLPNACLFNLLYPALDAGQCFLTNSNQWSGSYYRTSRDTRQRMTLRADVDWFAGRALGMVHQVRGGVIFEEERYHRRLDIRPDVVFTIYKGLFRPYGIATYRLPIPNQSIADVSAHNWGVYVEDQMKVRENLSVTAGLRLDGELIDGLGWSDFDPAAEQAEFNAAVAGGQRPDLAMREHFTAYETVGSFQTSLAHYLGTTTSDVPISSILVQSSFWSHFREPENMQVRNRNLAPRVSVAWDPASNGKTKLSLSAGRYYDKIFLAVPLIEQEPPAAFLTIFADYTGGYDRTWYGTYLWSPPSNLDQRTVDSELRTPYQDEVALSIEHEIHPETSVKATYIRRWFKDQLQDTDDNHVVGDYGRCVRDRFTGWHVDPTDGPDGVLDDCRHGGDGVPDPYQLNPGWGEILRVGNLNTTDYRAFSIAIARRFYRGWQLDGSYTWSEAIGDAEDFDQILGNDRTQLDAERGPLEYDQTHVLKTTATGVFPRGFRLGGTIRWESGLPYSVYQSDVLSTSVPPNSLGTYEDRVVLRYESGHRNDERNGAYWTVDLRLSKDFVLGSRANLQLSADIFNLMNDDTIRYYDVTDGVADSVRRFGRRWQLGMQLAF